MTGAMHAAKETRSLGLLSCISLVVGNMIGSGIFLLPASLGAFGAISLLGWLFTSIGAVILAIIFGRLALLVPRSGGPYAYTAEAYGEFIGFLIAWGYWIALWTGNAAVAVALVGYLGFLVPAIGASHVLSLAAALIAIWGLTLVNIRGVAGAGAVQTVTTLAKLVPLVAIVAYGIFHMQPAHFTPFNQSGKDTIPAISAVASLTLWAYLGLESATVPSGDVIDPARTIPRATVIGVLIAAIVYIGVTAVAIGALPAAKLTHSASPLADVASVFWGPSGGWFVAVGAVIATFGTLNGFTLLSGQVPYSAAQDRVFPAFLGERNGRGTPANALILSSVLASGVIMLNLTGGLVETFNTIILLAVMSSLLPYALCALAEVLIRLRTASSAPADRPRLVKAVILGGLGFAYSTWALSGSGSETVLYGVLLLMAGIPVYVWIKWRNVTSGQAHSRDRN